MGARTDGWGRLSRAASLGYTQPKEASCHKAVRIPVGSANFDLTSYPGWTVSCRWDFAMKASGDGAPVDQAPGVFFPSGHTVDQCPVHLVWAIVEVYLALLIAAVCEFEQHWALCSSAASDRSQRKDGCLECSSCTQASPHRTFSFVVCRCDIQSWSGC